ncbi:camphor resistance protein CrcB [Pseudonocardia kunmingensis]|uniref:Fluoride-specific ion channel FluC n=1 Tax=Pseudonocardia kunmingensis TaxID=630975 RepID=A0A543CYM1_9PSEU|nr:camphor resistance protein CrcB [Pseudonocardia kunmingensis]
MSGLTALWVALGAAVGAPLRYTLDRAVQARCGSRFPWGTLTVNMVGSVVLGALTGAATALPVGVVPAALQAAVGTGFCGALTTYSTFSYESVALLEGRRPASAAANLVGSVVAGLLLAGLAWWAVHLALT